MDLLPGQPIPGFTGGTFGWCVERGRAWEAIRGRKGNGSLPRTRCGSEEPQMYERGISRTQRSVFFVWFSRISEHVQSQTACESRVPGPSGAQVEDNSTWLVIALQVHTATSELLKLSCSFTHLI